MRRRHFFEERGSGALLEMTPRFVAAWNRWRRRKPNASLNYSGADLMGVYLEGMNLRGADFSGTLLKQANLRTADLRDADFESSDLSGANLENANLKESNLRSANLWGAKLKGANIFGVDLTGTDLGHADLGEVSFKGVTLEGTILQGANLTGASLRSKDLSGKNLSDTILKRADLRNANLQQADLRGSTFEGAKLCGASLKGAHLRGAIFTKADFSDAALDGLDVREATLSEAKFMQTNLGGVDLRSQNLSGLDFRRANLSCADLRRTSLNDAVLDGATLTNAKLWETQRAGWSIKRAVCEAAYWDKEGVERTEYKLGEFEKLFSENLIIVLHYKGGISLIEIATLPGLIEILASEHPGCVIHLKSIQEGSGGATVSIVVDEAGDTDLDILKRQLQEQAARLQAAQREIQEQAELRNIVESQITQLKDRIFPLLLAQVIERQRDAEESIKFLSLLFLDLRGFSGMNEAQRKGRIDLLRGLAEPLLKRGEGRYVNTWGDAIVAGFEKGEDAVVCACTLIQVLKAAGITARIGMSRGKTLVRYNRLINRLDIEGDEVNLAARLEPIANPGEVLISNHLRYQPDVDRSLQLTFIEFKRTLKKSLGKKKPGSEITCYSAMLKEAEEEWARSTKASVQN